MVPSTTGASQAGACGGRTEGLLRGAVQVLVVGEGCLMHLFYLHVAYETAVESSWRRHSSSRGGSNMRKGPLKTDALFEPRAQDREGNQGLLSFAVQVPNFSRMPLDMSLTTQILSPPLLLRPHFSRAITLSTSWSGIGKSG